MADEMTDEPSGGKTRDAMEIVAGLSIAEMAVLLDSVNGTTRFASRSEFRAAIRSAVPHLDEAESGNLHDFVFAYAEVILERGVPDEKKFIGNLVDSLEATISLPKEELAARILNLINAPSIALAVASSVLYRRRHHAVLRTSIQTDVRPITVPILGNGPSGYAITHSLRLTYTNDLYGEREEIADFSLDHEDLEALIKQSTFALKQELAVQDIHADSDARVWNPYEPSETVN